MKPAAFLLASCLLAMGCVAPSPGRSDVAADKEAISENGSGKLYSEVVADIGPPESEEDFVMVWGELEFRIELRNFFDRESIDAGEVKLRESTWSLDGADNLTIWFQQDGDVWRRVHERRWQDGDLF